MDFSDDEEDSARAVFGVQGAPMRSVSSSVYTGPGGATAFPTIGSDIFEEMFPRDALSERDRKALRGQSHQVMITETEDGGRMLSVSVPQGMQDFRSVALDSDVLHSEVGLMSGKATEAVETRRWMRAHLWLAAIAYALAVLVAAALLSLVLVALFGWTAGLVLGALCALWAGGLFGYLIFMVWRPQTGCMAWGFVLYAAPVVVAVAGVFGPPLWDGRGGTPGDWWRRALRRTHQHLGDAPRKDEEPRILTTEDFLRTDE